MGKKDPQKAAGEKRLLALSVSPRDLFSRQPNFRPNSRGAIVQA